MQAIRSGTDDVMKETLLNFCYPIGSIYWSGVATNPHDLFGGTWEQIKDKFVWAKGDNDVLDATGGEKTHTLTTTEMPSHTHTFTGSAVTSGANNRGHTHSVTASGTISVTTNPTFTGSEHSHSYTPAGSVSVTTNPTFSGSAVTSGASSASNTGNENSHTHGVGTIATGSGGGHTHRLLTYTGFYRQGFSNCYAPFTDSSDAGAYAGIALSGFTNPKDINDTWSDLPTSGQNASGYIRHGNWGAKKKN